jgi:tetratricopeptide (TPR) repeat protein
MLPLNDFQIGNQLIVKNKYKEAIESFLRHSENFPAEAAKCFERIAEANLRNYRRKEGEIYYRKSLELEPNLFRSLVGLSNILPKCAEEKLILMEKTVNIQSNYTLFIDIGDFYRSCKKDFEKAFVFYEKAWKRNPKDKSSYQRIWALCSITKDKATSEKWSQLYQQYYK